MPTTPLEPTEPSIIIESSKQLRKFLAAQAVATAPRTMLDVSIEYSMNQEELQALAELLRHNRTIERLSILGDNSIGAIGARILAEALQSNTTLRVLDLPGNDIGPEGARHLAETLKANTTLLNLNLEANNLTDEGARYIAEMLQVNTALRVANLAGNRISDAGALLLANALETNRTFFWFPGLENYGISQAIVARLTQETYQNQSLWQTMQVHDNRHRTNVTLTNLPPLYEALANAATCAKDKGLILAAPQVLVGYADKVTLTNLILALASREPAMPEETKTEAQPISHAERYLESKPSYGQEGKSR